MIDLTGQRFGRLLVIERAGSNKNGEATWDCLCDCGKAKVVLGTLLRRGATRSCGCYLSDAKIKNLVGRRFGKLIVIEIAGRTAAKKVLWKCRCDCGNEKVIIGAGLLRGRSTDCGCVPKPHHKKLYIKLLVDTNLPLKKEVYVLSYRKATSIKLCNKSVIIVAQKKRILKNPLQRMGIIFTQV